MDNISPVASATSQLVPPAVSPMIVRPWRGTVLAVLYIIGAVMSGIGILATFASMSGIGVAMGGMMAIFALVGWLAFVFLIPFFVLSILLAMGFLKGWRWAVIVAMVLSVLGILSSLRNFAIVSIVISAVLIHAEYLCYKHPFYNRAKKV